MVKQLLLPIAAVAAFIILVGILSKNAGNLDWAKYISPAQSPAQQKTMVVGSKTINVEVVNTESLREKGLGSRGSLDKNSGMLFVFDSKQVSPVFWMKGMQFPLDIIWINGTKIVKIDKNIQAPPANTSDANLKKIMPGRPIDYVLEVNAGFSDENKIKVNDSVTLPAGL